MVNRVILLLFVAMMIAIGLYSRGKVSSVNNLFFSGRQMEPWISVFVYEVTYFSTLIFIRYSKEIDSNALNLKGYINNIVGFHIKNETQLS